MGPTAQVAALRAVALTTVACCVGLTSVCAHLAYYPVCVVDTGEMPVLANIARLLNARQPPTPNDFFSQPLLQDTRGMY